MQIVCISAIARDRVIGYKGEIPWYISDDLKRFKSLTLNHPIIMGRKTYDNILNLLNKPLPNRENIVLTTGNLNPDKINVAHTIQEALEIASKFKDRVYILGGEQTYNLAMPFATNLELTEIDKEYMGDAFFPEFSRNEWKEISREQKNFQELRYDFVSYSRQNT